MRQFWERGYRATSVDDLVRATGVKPGSLYAAFPGGKHALLMGSLDRYSKLVVPVKLGELEQPGASVAEIRAYFDGLVRETRPGACDDDPPVAYSGPLSSTVTSVAPRAVSSSATAAPTTPAPITT